MKNKLAVYIILAIIILTGIFLILKPKEDLQTDQPQTTNQPSQISSTTLQENIKTFELVISNNKIISGEQTIKATEGDEVIIKVKSDESEEFHLHGYDQSIELQKDELAQLQFTANLTGRFVFELEESKTDLGALEVSPK